MMMSLQPEGWTSGQTALRPCQGLPLCPTSGGLLPPRAQKIYARDGEDLCKAGGRQAEARH